MSHPFTREVREIGSREEWLAWRRQDVPASIAPSLIEGADPYGHVDKVLAHVNGQPEPIQSSVQRRGILMEAVFPGALAEVHPEWRIVKANTYHRIPALRIGCTPDFWIYRSDDQGKGVPIGLVQAKTCNERIWERWQGRPPLGYTIQTLIEMMVTEQQRGVLAVIVINSDLPLYLYEVEPHPAAEAKILTTIANFWQAIDHGAYPLPAPKDEIADLLDDGSHKDLSADNRLPEWLERREQLIAERLEADRSIKGIDYEVKQRMGPASSGSLPGWQISFKTEHRKGYTVEPSDPRILRVKRTKEKDDADLE